MVTSCFLTLAAICKSDPSKAEMIFTLEDPIRIWSRLKNLRYKTFVGTPWSNPIIGKQITFFMFSHFVLFIHILTIFCRKEKASLLLLATRPTVPVSLPVVTQRWSASTTSRKVSSSKSSNSRKTDLSTQWMMSSVERKCRSLVSSSGYMPVLRLMVVKWIIFSIKYFLSCFR